MQNFLVDSIKFRDMLRSINQRKRPQFTNSCVCLAVRPLPTKYDGDYLSSLEVKEISTLWAKKTLQAPYFGIILLSTGVNLVKIEPNDSNTKPNIIDSVEIFSNSENFKQLLGILNVQNFLKKPPADVPEEFLRDWYFLSSVECFWIEHGVDWLKERQEKEFGLKMTDYLNEKMRGFFVDIQQETSPFFKEDVTDRVKEPKLLFTDEIYFYDESKKNIKVLYQIDWDFSPPNTNI
jgi:hypothetical protein